MDFDWQDFNLFAPTQEHQLLGESLREFVTREVEPQAADHDRSEEFNMELFRSAGELGLYGVVAVRMANLSWFKDKMVEWNPRRQKIVAT